jgi:hypothetical protein
MDLPSKQFNGVMETQEARRMKTNKQTNKQTKLSAFRLFRAILAISAYRVLFYCSTPRFRYK